MKSRRKQTCHSSSMPLVLCTLTVLVLLTLWLPRFATNTSPRDWPQLFASHAVVCTQPMSVSRRWFVAGTRNFGAQAQAMVRYVE